MWTLLLLLPVPAAAQQAPATPVSEPRTFLVFFRGAAVGRENLTLRVNQDGSTTMSAQVLLGAPLNVTSRRAEVRYRADWVPMTLVLDANVNNNAVTLSTEFSNSLAASESRENDRTAIASNPISPNTFPLPNIFYTAYEAVGRRLAAGGDTTGEFHAFVAPGVDVPFRVSSASRGQMQTGTATFPVRRYVLAFTNPTGEVLVNLATDESGGLVRLTAEAQGLDVVREDLATPTARTQMHANPGDEQVMIPGPGFNIGATLTRPAGTALPARLPAVVLLAGSGANDRDEFMSGIPILGQLAGSLAQAGFLVVRYDKRGNGQSGGRAESATLNDYADDARTVVNWLSRRRDVDSKRIAVIGHSEGGWVALLAASREGKIAAVAAMAAPATTGAELVLWQQERALDLINAPAAEREQKIALQKQIQSAVVTGRGWEGVPANLRRQADTPWFQSFLAYNPATVIDDVKQPMLFVQGDLDRQVPADHLNRLADLARKTSKSKSIDAVSVRGVNHLLIPATTGEVTEYATLPDRNVSRDVSAAVAGWLTKTFAAVR